MNFDPFADYDPALDALDRSTQVRRAKGDPPGALCWVFVASRRGGKTWTLKALRHHLGAQAQYIDAQGSCFSAPSGLQRGDVLLIDEPGHTLESRGVAFVDECRKLQREGVRVVVAMTPAEHERLSSLCKPGVGDVSKANLPSAPLTSAGEQKLTERDVSMRALLADVPEQWRSTPFFLELFLLAKERDATLSSVNAIARAAIDIADDEYDYTHIAWRQALSSAQREIVRRCLRGESVRGTEADLLVAASVLRRDASDRCRVLDPILAANLSVLRIHHVSDVHVGPKAGEAVDIKADGVVPADAVGPRYVRERYIEHLTQRRNAGTGAHVLVCSGDCVEYASEKAQYDEFHDWLQRAEGQLAEHPAVPETQRALLVGGNHDVDWNLAARGDRTRHAAFATMAGARPHPRLHEEPEHRTVAQVSFPEAGVTVALLGSAEYGGTITQDPLRKALHEAAQRAEEHIPAGDTALLDRVKSLRTKLADDPVAELRGVLDELHKKGLDDAKVTAIEGLHWKVMRIDPGLVDDHDLKRVRAHEWTHPVRIAVLHHPVSPLPELELARFGGLINAGAVKETLLEKGFQLVLHGHVHRGWFAEEKVWRSDGKPRSLAVASAPTLGSRETSKDPGFNEIEIARDYDANAKPCYAVTVRRYARNNATYEPDGPAMSLAPIYP